MKHSDFSRKDKRIKGFKDKAFLLIFLSFNLLILTTGCVKHDELEFKGKIVFVRQCEFSYLDQNPGYMVQLEYPEGVGGEYIDGENVAENVIVLYEPGKHIMVGDVIHGKFYLSPKYSKANCSVHWDYELPEGVFTKVEVE